MTLPLKQDTAHIDLLCAKSPIIPVVAIERAEDAVPLAQALSAGGIDIIEVTLRTHAALDAMAAIRKHVPQMTVAAGTISNCEQYDAAVMAGASLVISPGMTQRLLEHALSGPAPLLPGIATASELMTAQDLGYTRFKFFPAEAAGSIAMLKALAGPFAHIKFCPTGGVSEQNVKHYLALDNVMCVGGSWLAPSSSVNNQHWQQITAIAQQSLAACR
ncbi:MAG: bifunctional 4-hydroxy-2-oxoglutarate aldolase/2-dehydro-3-deoxy-phosphogluconate aldolase [Pseudomonadales bacterium]